MVTHLTTNLPVDCLYMAEQTGSLVLNLLWSYVIIDTLFAVYIAEFTLLLGCLPYPYPPTDCLGLLSRLIDLQIFHHYNTTTSFKAILT